MKLKPKNWQKFQHYKNRRPPWIKLHRELLEDRAFMMLPLASKGLAPMLWLLAAESDTGEFDASIEELCFRLRLTEGEINQALKPLIDNGLFVSDSKMLASCSQVASKSLSETEGETETEREVRFKPPTVKQVMEYCRERKNNVDPNRFVDFYESKGWMVGKNKMKNWQAAVRQWEKKEDKASDYMQGVIL